MYHDPMGNVLTLVAAAIYGISERVFAIRWLRDDARARGTSSVPWVILAVLVPIVSVGLYLIVRPRGPLVRCPHCGAASLATGPGCLRCGQGWEAAAAGATGVPGGAGAGSESGSAGGGEAGTIETVVWRLPAHAIVPLGAIAAVVLIALIPMMGYFYYELDISAGKTLVTMGVAAAIAIVLFASIAVRTQRAPSQDNPFPLLAGLLLAMATIIRLTLIKSAGAMALAAVILALAAMLVISAALHLSAYHTRGALRGLAMGYVLAMVATFGLFGGRYGFGVVPSVTALCVSLPTIAIAALSGGQRFERANGERPRVGLLQVAGPLWGLLAFAIVVSIASQALR